MPGLLPTFEVSGLLPLVALCLHLLGAFSAIHAIMGSRVSQSAVAWCIALVSFPYLSLPLYWIFGVYQESTSVDLKALRMKQAQAMLHSERQPEPPDLD